ncbi:MAG: iron chelate uptake ABC transporter family permease subunit [Vicinamibacterales bacterium]
MSAPPAFSGRLDRTDRHDVGRPHATREAVALLGLGITLGVTFLLSLALGSTRVPLADVAAVLTRSSSVDAGSALVLESIRLPRSLTAVLAGAALGIAGLQMQTLFRNPLADPFALGISSGASLGVALVVLGSNMSVASAFGASTGLAGDALLIAAAIAGAIAVLMVVLAVSARVSNPATVLILGLMFGYTASAIVTVLVGMSSPERLMQLARWGFGSFSGVTWQRLWLFAPTTAAGVMLAGCMTKQLNAPAARRELRTIHGCCRQTRPAADDVGRIDPWRGGDGVLRTGRLSGDCSAPPLSRTPRNVESSRARSCRHHARRDRRPGGADRVADTRQCRCSSAQRRHVNHRCARGRRHSAPEPSWLSGVMTTASATAPTLEARDLAVGYDTRRHRRAVLERVNVSVNGGDLVCLLGPNGIGKSTLMRTLARMQPALWREMSSAALPSTP